MCQKFTLLTRSHTSTVSSLPTQVRLAGHCTLVVGLHSFCLLSSQNALTSAVGSRLDDSVVSRISSIQPGGLHQSAGFLQDGVDGTQQLLAKGRARGADDITVFTGLS